MTGAQIPIYGETSSPAARSPWVSMKSSAPKSGGLRSPRPLRRKFCRNPSWSRPYSFTDPVSNAIVADALLEQELVIDPKAAAQLEAIRQLDDVSYDTGFEPSISDVELDGLDLER